MKLVRNIHGDDPYAPCFGVAEAIDHACAQDTPSGLIERVEATALNASAMLGRLVEILRRKGALDDRDVIQLLGHRWSRA